jgi:hypothetical protein
VICKTLLEYHYYKESKTHLLKGKRSYAEILLQAGPTHVAVLWLIFDSND